MWLNSDDTLTDGAVRIAVRALAEHPDVDLVYSDFWGLDDATGGMTRWKSRQVDLPTLIKRNVIPQPTVFMRRRLFERVGPVEESLHLTMDWQLWLRAARVSRLLYLRGPCLATLRDHPEAKTRALYGRRVEEQLLILERLYGDPTLPRAARRNRRMSYSHVYWEAAEHAMLRGRSFPHAIGWLARSVVNHPVAAMSRPLTTLKIVLSAIRDVARCSVRGGDGVGLDAWPRRRTRAQNVRVPDPSGKYDVTGPALHGRAYEPAAAPELTSERRGATSHERAPLAVRIDRDQAHGRRTVGNGGCPDSLMVR